MKKLLSVILAIIIMLIPCTAFAFDIEGDVIQYSSCDEISGSFFIVIVLPEEYKTFADDIKVTLVQLDKDYQELSEQIYSGNDVICLKENYTHFDVTESLVIYIPYAKNLKGEKVGFCIPEDSVFDSKGNGNKEIKSIIHNLYSDYNKSHKKDRYPYSIGDTVTYNTHLPVDYYLNGTLVSENSSEYVFKIKKSGEYKVEMKKFGITLNTDDINTKEKKKENLDELRGNSTEVLGLVLISPILFLLTPLLGVFPPLMAGSLAAPFVAVYGCFVVVRDFLYLIFH